MSTLDNPLRASRIITSQLPGANLGAMPLHWAITEAIRKRDEQEAEVAMRKLVIITTEDIQRALDVELTRKEESNK